MNSGTERNTEEKILKAARQVFTEKGMAGARMQEIADKAGINKAMLHYYFRSKEKLFDRVFKEAFGLFWPRVDQYLQTTTDLKTLLKAIVTSYIDVLIDQPFLPIFILNELHRNPDHLKRLFFETGVDPTQLLEIIKGEMAAGNIVEMDPRELLVNILSLSLFPFAARPLVSRILWDNDQESYVAFLKERKNTVYEFIVRAVFVSSAC
ncbi:TetR/AcrR family transcriptional regulator [Marinilabiliaceae bacterium JC017]|nr:TetR/AcrR family transcriptional regulator [Marinilabiliaceae bacterium JC017]